MAVAEMPEPRRRWQGYAILERDEKLYRIAVGDPKNNEHLDRLLELGWFVVPVDIIER